MDKRYKYYRTYEYEVVVAVNEGEETDSETMADE